MLKIKIALTLCLCIFMADLSHSKTFRHYLPEETILYLEMDLGGIQKLFRDLTLKFYSEEHYKQIKEYLTDLGKTDLGIDVTNSDAIKSQGLDPSKKVLVALMPPMDLVHDIVYGAYIKDRTRIEKSVLKIFNSFHPKVRLKDEIKSYKRKNLRDLLKKDVQKIAIEQRVRDFQYKNYKIKVFRKKVKGYSKYSYHEMFSYVIIDDIIFFGKKWALTRVINGYVHRENLLLNKDLTEVLRGLDRNARIRGYFSFRNLLKLFSLKPLTDSTIINLFDGLGFSFDLNTSQFSLKTLMRLKKDHSQYELALQAFYPEGRERVHDFKRLPAGQFSYLTSRMDWFALKKLVPLYEYLFPIARITSRYMGEFSHDKMIFDFFNNLSSDMSLALYMPPNNPPKLADYHPHKLNILFYTRIKKTSNAYNFIDYLFYQKLKDKHSIIKEIQLNDSPFYYLSTKYLKLYMGVYKKRFIVSTQLATLKAFIENINQDQVLEKVRVNRPIDNDLSAMIRKENHSFLSLYFDFDVLPHDLELLDKGYKPLQKFKYLYATGKIDNGLMRTSLVIKLK